MSDDFAGRSNAARLDDLIAANPEDRAFVNSGAAEDFCLLRARCRRGFFHFCFPRFVSRAHDTGKREILHVEPRAALVCLRRLGALIFGVWMVTPSACITMPPL